METVTIFTFGDSRGNPGPAAIGVQILNEQGQVIKNISEKIGNATESFAEYQAVMRGLQTLKEIFGEKTKEIIVELKLNNDLVKQQLSSECQIKEPGLVPHFIEIHNLRVSSFPHITFTHVLQERNKEADRLVNEALDAA